MRFVQVALSYVSLCERSEVFKAVNIPIPRAAQINAISPIGVATILIHPIEAYPKFVMNHPPRKGPKPVLNNNVPLAAAAHRPSASSSAAIANCSGRMII